MSLRIPIGLIPSQAKPMISSLLEVTVRNALRVDGCQICVSEALTLPAQLCLEQRLSVTEAAVVWTDRDRPRPTVSCCFSFFKLACLFFHLPPQLGLSVQLALWQGRGPLLVLYSLHFSLTASARRFPKVSAAHSQNCDCKVCC